MAKRNEFLDIVKFVAIFLVLWGHVIQQSYCAGKVDPNPYLDTIYCIIYTVHMPLFMGLCGYFFSLSINKVHLCKKDYVKKRIKSLIIPMLSFGLIKFLIDVYLKNNDINIILYLKDVKDIWFLGDLAVNTIIVYFLMNVLSGSLRKDWKWLVIGMAFSVIPYAGQGIFMYIFFILGFYIKQYVNKVKLYFFNFKYIVSATFLYLIIYKMYISLGVYSFQIHFKIFKYGSDFMMACFFTNILKVLLGIIGIYILMFIIWKIRNIRCLSVFMSKAKEYGKYTLELYLLNIIILEYILGHIIYKWIVIKYNYNIIQDNGFVFEFFSTFILSLIIMEICLFITNKIYKYPKISKILFYKVKINSNK